MNQTIMAFYDNEVVLLLHSQKKKLLNYYYIVCNKCSFNNDFEYLVCEGAFLSTWYDKIEEIWGSPSMM